MKQYSCLKKVAPISFIVIALASANLLNRQTPPIINIPLQKTAVNISSNFLTVFHMGNTRMISSMIWLKTLIDADNEHYKTKDLNSWMYLRFKSINDIDPKFYEPYKMGGQYLSVIKDDDIGAIKIFEQGLKEFPDDFWLNFYAGFQYFAELGDYELAFKKFNHIKDHHIAKTQVTYIASIAARLKAKTGSLEDAYDLLLSSYQNTTDKRIRKKYGDYLYAIKAEIDLKCLNGGLLNCSRVDFDGNRYVLRNSSFVARIKWKKFKLNIKNKK